MGVQDYRHMDSAPRDGSVIMVLAGSKHPVPAYWDMEGWRLWHSGKYCEPDYWTELPGSPPSDYHQDEQPHTVVKPKKVAEPEPEPVKPTVKKK